MLVAIARFLEQRFNFDYDWTLVQLNRLVITLAALLFVTLSTLIVAFDALFPSQGLASLQVGDIAPTDIYAPRSVTYTSSILTEQRRESVAAAVSPIYDVPDPVVARQQTELARQILEFIENIRRDPYGEEAQKIEDIQQITALDLDEDVIRRILEISPENWQDISDQITFVLESVFQDEIRDNNLGRIRSLLPTRVSVRFDEPDVNVIVAIVNDLVRSNTSLNEEATAAAREQAVSQIQPETRSFERGQIVVSGGIPISALDYEALQQLGLLRMTESRIQEIVQAFLVSVVVLVSTGLYVARFQPSLLYHQPRLVTLLSIIFLLVLAGARLGLVGQIYIYPTAAMALLYVAISGPQIAVIGVLGLAFMVGIMADTSLEISTLVTVGGLIGLLSLHRSERLNSFFISGLLVGLGNIAVLVLFNLPSADANEFALLLVYGILNGILTAAAALAGLYIVTLFFNLPTALKLAELSQPNQPLLQRLLREAPGTYQHSLQVGNLSEQAANAIGANAELTHVAALYHDIGKMLNPAFFTENQQYIGNPHDTLNDPYRSADIIISHVTGGDEMARQYRLPSRLRDFILEHHGTSQVFVFYKQAVILAGDDESAVDIAEFTYPGPRPRSRETAILMLADSCEAATRSNQPKSREEIQKIVLSVINGKQESGQLDESGLTLKDLKTIQNIFVEMLQAMFHPRINYNEAVSRVRKTRDDGTPDDTPPEREPAPKPKVKPPERSTTTMEMPMVDDARRQTNDTVATILDDDDDEDTPLPEVPRLRRVVEPREEGENET